MADDAPSTETPAAAARPVPGAPSAVRPVQPATETEQHDAHEHEIAGFRVGLNPIPFSAIIVFLFILLIATVAWIPTYGF